MLTIQQTGDTLIIGGLREMCGGGIQRIQDRTLRRVVPGVHRKAHERLSGPGGTGKKVRREYEGFERKNWGAEGKSHFQTFTSYENAGGYPVPVRTGNLRGRLDFLFPGESKEGFAAAANEGIVFDSAEYAATIHEGKGSSAKFGRRPFITDGLEDFDHGGRIVEIAGEETDKEMKRLGLT